MSLNQQSWERNLRNESAERKTTSISSPERTKKSIRSPQKNTESQDYDPRDFIRKSEQVSHEAHIIADPFKPTMNKWIKEEEIKDCSIHHFKHVTNKQREEQPKM